MERYYQYHFKDIELSLLFPEDKGLPHCQVTTVLETELPTSISSQFPLSREGDFRYAALGAYWLEIGASTLLPSLHGTDAPAPRLMRTIVPLQQQPSGVVVVPITSDGEVVLLDEFRPSVGKRVLNLPRGNRTDSEAPCETALRELKEEIGASRVREFGIPQELGRLATDPGLTTSEVSVVVIDKLVLNNDIKVQPHEPRITMRKIHPAAISYLISSGELCDSLTISALMLCLAKKFLVLFQNP